MRKLLISILGLGLISLMSCQLKDESRVLAKKIQYDVNIISPDPSYDWWIQNLVGPERELLSELLIDAPVKGRVQAFDYFNKPLTPQQVKQVLVDTSYVMIRSTLPPYEEKDTMIVKRISPKDIVRLRFMEEWRMDTATLQMEKKVYGIGPVIKSFDSEGNFRGYQPLYWIYTDENFRKEVAK